MIENLIILIGLHFIADFSLQNDFQAKFKATNKYIMLAHCIIWATTIYFGLIYIGIAATWKWLFLVSTHFISDTIKCNKVDKRFSLTDDLYLDQFSHIFQIVFVFAL